MRLSFWTKVEDLSTYESVFNSETGDEQRASSGPRGVSNSETGDNPARDSENGNVDGINL